MHERWDAARVHARAVGVGCAGAIAFAALLKLDPHRAGISALAAGALALAGAAAGVAAAVATRRRAERLDDEGGASHEVIRLNGVAYRSWFAGQAALFGGVALLGAGLVVTRLGSSAPVAVLAIALAAIAAQSLRGPLARGLRSWELGLGWALPTPEGGRPGPSFSTSALRLSERMASARRLDRDRARERGAPSPRFRAMFQTVDLGRRRAPYRRVDLSRPWLSAWRHELRVRTLGLGLVGLHGALLGALAWLVLDLAGVEPAEAAVRRRDPPPFEMSLDGGGPSGEEGEAGLLESDPSAGSADARPAPAEAPEPWERRYADAEQHERHEEDPPPPRSQDGSSQRPTGARSSAPGAGPLPPGTGDSGARKTARSSPGSSGEMRTVEGPRCTKQHEHGKDCNGGSSSSGAGDEPAAGGRPGDGEEGKPGQGQDGRVAGAEQGGGTQRQSAPPTPTQERSRSRAQAAGSGTGDPLGGPGDGGPRDQRGRSGSHAPIVVDITPDGPAQRLLERRSQRARGTARDAATEGLRRPGSAEPGDGERWQPLPERFAELRPTDDTEESP